MKFLITGCAGYIGSKLVQELLCYPPNEVVGVDNLMYGGQSLYGAFGWDNNFTFINADVMDLDAYKEHLFSADVIIPLAALVGAPLCDKNKREAIRINTEAIKLLARLVTRHQRLIYPTTNSGYGLGQFNDDGSPVHCTEETKLTPLSLYGRTKCDAEKAILDVGGISLRLATVFGMSPRPRMDLLVNNWTYKACDDGYLGIFQGGAMRNYVHIMDVMRAFSHCFSNIYPRVERGEVYNLGNDSINCSKLELAESIRKLTPLKIFEVAGEDPDKRNYIVSSKKLMDTGWRPRYNLDCGIAEIIDAYPVLKHSSTVLGNY